MQVAILGPLTVHDGEREITVAGLRLAVLLQALALEPGRVVSVETLTDVLWEQTPPSDAVNALQSLVSRLRRVLGDPSVVQAAAGGYRLALDPDAVDAHRFERAVVAARASRRDDAPEQTAQRLRAALALWRGEELAQPQVFTEHARRLGELRLEALALAVQAELELGRHAELVTELRSLVAQYRLQEQFVAQLMTALAGSGRAAQALAVYEDLRVLLADELGADPSADVQQLHLQILRGNPALQAHPAAAVSPTPAVPVHGGNGRGNVRTQLSSFVGRETEIRQVADFLRQSRLVTLVGPGGAGKTRLACEWAQSMGESAADGVWFAALASVSDSSDTDNLAQTVLDSLGLREAILLDRPAHIGAVHALQRLIDSLGEKKMVLILDNCEHLVTAAAQFAERLLSECPGLRVLATSREPLGIFGESLLVVPELGQPEPDADIEQALRYPAVQLFADRARDANTGFDITPDTVADVVEIVRRLDGLPLAIELAAAKLRALSLHDIATRLDDRFRLLTAGSRTALPRQRTLRAVVEWSWDLLTEAERMLWERMAIFPAGASVDAVEAICSGAGIEQVEVLDLLTSLLDKSLLQRVDTDITRYRMLETIREYGYERLIERGEDSALLNRHAYFYATLMSEISVKSRTAEQLRWLQRFFVDRDNLLMALRTLVDLGDASAAVTLAIEAGWSWMLQGNSREILAWHAIAATATTPVNSTLSALARGQQIMGATAIMHSSEESVGRFDAGREAIATICTDLDNADLSDYPIGELLRSVASFFSGDDERAQRVLADAMAVSDPWVRAAARVFRASLAENRGDITQMLTDAALALAEFQALGERWGMANSLQVLAQAHTLTGDLDQAVAEYHEAIRVTDDLGSIEDKTVLWVQVADLYIRLGDMAAATGAVAQARAAVTENGWAMPLALLESVEAELAYRSGNIGKAKALRDDMTRHIREFTTGHPIEVHVTAIVHGLGARLDLYLGELAVARQHLQTAYRMAVDCNDQSIMATIAVVTADLALQLDMSEESAEIIGASDRLRGHTDATQLDVARIVSALRDGLGAEFESHYQRGLSLDRASAIRRIDPAALRAL